MASALEEEITRILLGFLATENEFDILGVQFDCNYEQVRQSFKRMSLRVHPDKNSSKHATAAFKRSTWAYNNMLKYMKTAKIKLVVQKGAWVPTANCDLGGDECVSDWPNPLDSPREYVEVFLVCLLQSDPPCLHGKVIKKDSMGRPFKVDREIYETNIAEPKWEDFIALCPRHVYIGCVPMLAIVGVHDYYHMIGSKFNGNASQNYSLDYFGCLPGSLDSYCVSKIDVEYEGDWKDGKRHGKGTATLSDGRKYEGGWKDDNPHGKGIQFGPDNTRIYEGDWKDGKYHGKGTATLSNGSKYEGDWKDGKRHGKGTLLCSGCTYIGKWKDDKRHGKGIQTYSNGSKCEGAWKYGSMHGKGTFMSESGEKTFDGYYKDGLKCGISTDMPFDDGVGDVEKATQQLAIEKERLNANAAAEKKEAARLAFLESERKKALAMRRAADKQRRAADK